MRLGKVDITGLRVLYGFDCIFCFLADAIVLTDIVNIRDLFDDIIEPPLQEDILACAAGEDGIIDDLEIIEILNAWLKQKDYKGCGVPTDDDYMKALGLWIKRQPVDDEGQACQADPKIMIADSSKPQGERFLGKGVGFSPNNQAILHLQNQYGQEILTQIFDTNPEGKFLIRIENTNLQLGTYSVWFEDKCSRKRSNTESLIVEPANPNRPPAVTLTYWPENPTPDDIVYFEARASDPDSDPLTYEWYLNGVKQTMATAASVQWARPTEGSHTMTVKVFDNKGGKGEASVTFTVQKKRSQAPQITSVGIPNEITINIPTNWQLSFYDPEGDVNWIRFEQLVNSNWVSAGEWDPQVSGQTRGTIGIKTTCKSLGTVIGRVLLKDAAGNSSDYYEYSYQCVPDEFPPPPQDIILGARYKSECPVCVGDYCYDFPSVKCVVFAWQYEATDVLLFEIKSMYTDSSGYSETLNQVNPVIKEYTEMLTEDKKVCVQVRAQTSSGYTDWSNKVCATIYAITPSSRWQPELSSKVIMAKIQIFTLGGQLVYSTDLGDPKRLEWDLKDYRNLLIANGVYLVVITTNNIYGLVYREVRKIVVLR